MTAMVSGVISQPSVFRQGDIVASVLELQVTMEKGNITRVDWIHGCKQCGPYQCVKALVVNEKGYGMVNEENCYSNTKQCFKPGEPECDTQVFVTWTGTDKDGEYFESVNYSIQGLRKYGGSKYMDSARKIAQQTYKELEKIPDDVVALPDITQN